jgi:hypothetical protein
MNQFGNLDRIDGVNMAKMTVEETKESLKKEIIRLGIQDNPSRTVYQKEYQRGAAPSPNNAMKVTGMKWQDLMNELGFKYDGQKAVAQGRIKGGRNLKNKKYGLRLNDRKTLDGVVKQSLSLIHELCINDRNQFEQELPKYINTTYKNLVDHGYSFEKLKELYKDKYGEEIKNNTRWSYTSNRELIHLLVRAMNDNNLDNLQQYKDWCKGNKDYPSLNTLQRRLDMTYTELGKLVKVLK